MRRDLSKLITGVSRTVIVHISLSPGRKSLLNRECGEGNQGGNARGAACSDGSPRVPLIFVEAGSKKSRSTRVTETRYKVRFPT